MDADLLNPKQKIRIVQPNFKTGSVFIRKNKTIMFILTGTLLPTICMQLSAKRGYCVKKIIIIIHK